MDPPPPPKLFGLNSVGPGAPLGGLAQDLVRRELGGRGVWGAPRMRGCPGVGLGDKLFTVVVQ